MLKRVLIAAHVGRELCWLEDLELERRPWLLPLQVSDPFLFPLLPQVLTKYHAQSTQGCHPRYWIAQTSFELVKNDSRVGGFVWLKYAHIVHFRVRIEEGASEAIISKTFSEMTHHRLSIIILDEIDMIASETAVKKAGQLCTACWIGSDWTSACS